MGLFGTQPSGFQTSAFQAPGLMLVSAVGTSIAQAYQTTAYFYSVVADGIIVPPEFRDIPVVAELNLVYAQENHSYIVVEQEVRLVYSPPNTI